MEGTATLEGTLLEAMIILGLIVVNGFFSCAEIAVVSSHKARIKQLAEQGDIGARHVVELLGDTDRFLATVQVGITVVGATAATLGGASADQVVEPYLYRWLPASMHELVPMLSLATVVAVISYLTLVLGELLPKALAVRYPDTIATWLGRPIHRISILVYPFAYVLSLSSRFLLRLLRVDSSPSSPLATEEDIKLLLREGREKGEIEAGEQELIHSVFDFTDTHVREIMVPRPRMRYVDIQMPLQEILNLIAENMHARYPVYDGDRICGILNYKDLIQIMRDPDSFSGGIRKMLHPPYFVPETMKVLRLLKELQRRHMQMAVVVNEYGDVSGLVTVVDIVEEIVGDIRDEYDPQDDRAKRLRDGSLVVDADTTIGDLDDDYKITIAESPEYESLGGFMLDRLQGIPHGGEVVREGDYRFTIVDMDGMRISRVKIDPPSGQSAPPANGGNGSKNGNGGDGKNGKNAQNGKGSKNSR